MTMLNNPSSDTEFRRAAPRDGARYRTAAGATCRLMKNAAIAASLCAVLSGYARAADYSAGAGANVSPGAGANVLSLGYARIVPLASSTPATVTNVAGHPVDIVQQGTSFGAGQSNTLGYTFEHYFTDNLGVKFLGGLPVPMNLVGKGTLESYDVLGDSTPWSPILVASYHFLTPESQLRPFVSLGVGYVWFTTTRVTNPRFVTDTFGPGGTVTATVSRTWNMAAEIGASYAITEHWGLDLGVIYLNPETIKARLYGHTASGINSISTFNISVRPLIPYVLVSYRF